jgi:hypothetical protein
MTKTVRIENADTNTAVKLNVITEDKVLEKGVDTGEWKESARTQLNHPTAQCEVNITNTRRVVIEETHNEV